MTTPKVAATHALIAALLAGLAADKARAVTYASGVRDLGGSTYEFILNDAAADVTISRIGDSDLQLGALPAGRHTFALGAGSAFDINVTSFNRRFDVISDSANAFTTFNRPAGIAVNNDPASPFFGTVYVSNGPLVGQAAVLPRGNVGGIYPMTADRQGVDLSDFSAVTDATRTDYIGTGGFDFEADFSDPWALGLDDAGNVLVSGRTTGTSGIKFFSPDLQTSGLVLDGIGNENSTNHGRTSSRVYAEGEVGSTTNPLTIWAMDTELLNDSGGVLGAGSGTAPSLWRWQVGSDTASTVSPDLWVDTNAIPATANGDSNFLQFVGIRTYADYSPVTDKWYLTNNRSAGNEGGLVVVSADGSSQTVEWTSFDTTIALGLDGRLGQQLEDDPATPDFDESTLIIDTTVQDIIRSAQDVHVSADGRTLYLHRATIGGGVFPIDGSPGVVDNDENPHLGANSTNPGRILAIPLDENGIPVIELDDNGTPDTTLDDQISNWESIVTPANGTFAFRSPLEIDIAGNVYGGDDATGGDEFNVYSPGGAVITTFSNNAALTDGTFAKVEGEFATGDYNFDGVVDAADYTLWRDGDLAADGDGNGVVDAADYTLWSDNYGATAVFATSASVPEAGSALLAAIGLIAAAGRRW